MTNKGGASHDLGPVVVKPSVAEYGDPQTLERVVKKLMVEFGLALSGPDRTLDGVIQAIETRLAKAERRNGSGPLTPSASVPAYSSYEYLLETLCTEINMDPKEVTTLNIAVDVIKERIQHYRGQVESLTKLIQAGQPLPSPNPFSDFISKALESADVDAPAAFEILKVCLELAVFLMSKNKKYGNSALKPISILSRVDPIELIKVRMDDKINRMMQGNVKDDEDVVWDFMGYGVLLRVAQRMLTPSARPGNEASRQVTGTGSNRGNGHG